TASAASAGGNLPAERASVAGHFLGVVGHPHVVPTEHAHGETEDGRVEEFLAVSGKGLGDASGKQGDDTGTDGTRGDSAGDPASAARGPQRRRKHDADDQRSFERLTEDDDGNGEHRRFLQRAIRWPRTFGLKSLKNS